MKLIILGGDGYLGWPTSMHFASQGYEVWSIDNYLRRDIAKQTDSDPLFPNPKLKERADIFESVSGNKIHALEGDCTDYKFLSELFENVRPDAVIH